MDDSFDSFDSFDSLFEDTESTIKLEEIKYSIADVHGYGDAEMVMSFNNQNEVILYAAFDANYAENIIKDKNQIKIGTKLYEYDAIPFLLADMNTFSENSMILRFAVDIKGCLDTLNMKHIEKLQDTYKIMRSKDLFSKQDADIDKQVISRFITEAKKKGLIISCIREVIQEGKLIYARSKYKDKAYIKYTVLNIKCIKNIEKYN